MKLKYVFAVLAIAHGALAQSSPTGLLVTNIAGITSSWAGECGANTVDNRSSFIRQNLYHSVAAQGTGSWSVTITYSNTSCAGPWTSYGSSATINQSSNPPIATAYDGPFSPAQFINIAITGNAVATYTAEKQLFMPSTGSSSTTFPITISQGGTNAGSVIGAKANLNIVPVATSDYNYPTQAPGGTLIAGGIGQAVTLAPCPFGVVNGSAWAPVYISGGTGTAESVIPIGGSCTSGASSGTISITPANAHSGGWTVKSATAGVEEALLANLGASVRLPCAVIQTYATISVNSGSELAGCGADAYTISGSVIDNMDSTGTVATISAGPEYSFASFGAYLHDFSINCGAGARLCGDGIDIPGTNTATISFARIERVVVQNPGGTGILMTYCLACRIRDAIVNHSGKDGINISLSCNNTKLDHVGAYDSSWQNGYANIQVATSLDVVIDTADSEQCGGNPAHAGVTTCYNFLISSGDGTRLINSYSEVAAPASAELVYVGPSAVNTTISGNFFDDGIVQTDGVDVNVGANYWASFSSIATGLTASSNQSTVTFTGRQSVGIGSYSFSPAPYSTATATSGAATINAQSGTVTSESLATAVGAIYTLTLTDSNIAAASVVTASVALGSSTQGTPQIVSVSPASGYAIVTVKNIDSTNAFNGTIKIKVAVSNLN